MGPHVVHSDLYLRQLWPLWLFLGLQMNFLDFIRMGFQLVANLFHKAPVLICFIKLEVFVYVVAHLILLIFFLHLLTTVNLLLARLES